MTFAHCDGFEICVNNIPKSVVESAKAVLLNAIQVHLSQAIIKNMLITTRSGVTFLWFTLNTETSRLTPRTMNELNKVLQEIRLHARTFWRCGEVKSSWFELTKIDVACDLKGAFLI